MKSMWRLMNAAIAGWNANFASNIGAALAYYAVLLIIVIAVADTVRTSTLPPV